MADKDEKVDCEGYVYKKDWLSGEYRRKENFWGQPERETDFFGQPKKGQRADTWWGSDVKSEKGRQLYEPKGRGSGDPVGDAAGNTAGCLLGLLLVGLFWLLGKWIKFCWRNPLVGLPITAVVLVVWFLSTINGQGSTPTRHTNFLKTFPIRPAMAETVGLRAPTRTPRPRSTPTVIVPESTPASALPLKATPVPVTAEAKPLAIDFLIDSIEMRAEGLKFNVTVKRSNKGNPLPWFSDEDRKDEIYLSISSQRYKLREMGGLFTQDTTLQPGQSYQGWFIFEPPGGNSFAFHYPDVKPFQINLEKLGVGKVVVSPAAASTPQPTGAPSSKSQPIVVPVSCSKQPQGDFARLWQAHPDWFGCPFANEISPLYGQFAEMPFEKGHLFWLGHIDEYGEIRLVIATFGGQNKGDTGVWLTQPETWNGEGICGASPPSQGLYLPDRGLAKVWCEIEGINRLGYATAPQEFVPNRGVDAIQNFEKAVIFRDSNGYTHELVYVLFRETNSYIVVVNQ